MYFHDIKLLFLDLWYFYILFQLCVTAQSSSMAQNSFPAHSILVTGWLSLYLASNAQTYDPVH